MSDPRDPGLTRPDDTDLVRAFSLAERLLTPGAGGAEAPAAAPAGRLRVALAQVIRSLRYWLWRTGGRRRAGGADRMAENYEREIARLTDVLRGQGEKALARERERVAGLERLTNQLQRAHEAEVEKLRRQLAESRPAPADELDRSRSRAAAAEERARLAENKVEMLKEALEITRARQADSRSTASAPAGDNRFREAKRAFARCFHPDHGGRHDPERERMFLEFWPVLERIERGE